MISPVEYLRDRTRFARPEGKARTLTGGGRWKQKHSGSTMHAMAAYLEMREAFVGEVRVTAVSQGDTTQHYVLLEAMDTGEQLHLDGVSWGYGGTGPNGFAAILADLGFFDGDRQKALEFLIMQPQNKGFGFSGENDGYEEVTDA